MALQSKNKKGEFNMSEKIEDKTKTDKVEKDAIIPDPSIEIKAMLQKILDRIPEPAKPDDKVVEKKDDKKDKTPDKDKVEKTKEKTPEKKPEDKKVEKTEEKTKDPEKTEEAKVEKVAEPEKDVVMERWLDQVSKKLGVPTPSELELPMEEVIKTLNELSKDKELPAPLRKFLDEYEKNKEATEEVPTEDVINKAITDQINKRFGEVEPVKRTKVINEEDKIEKRAEDYTVEDLANLSWEQTEILANKIGSD